MARGESEAIALALQESALLVGIDDDKESMPANGWGFPLPPR